MPSAGSGGATNTDASSLRRGATAHGLLAGVISGGIVLSIIFIAFGLWIWRRRRLINRREGDSEDEHHLFRANCEL